MTGEEFVRRYAMHILPDRFTRIRYAGMFAAGHRRDWLAKCRELLGTDGQEPVEEQRLEGEQQEEVRPGPECRHCGVPDMVSTGNRTAYETDEYLAYLCVLFDRMFTWLSTFDIDRPTLRRENESYNCMTESVVITCVTTEDILPLPDT